MTVSRRINQVLFVAGLAALVTAAAVSFGVAALPVPTQFLWGIGLAAWGLNALLAGDLAAGREPKPYIVRGQVVRGELVIRAGANDASVGVCGPNRVAEVIYGPLGKPQLDVRDGFARVALLAGVLRPNLATWGAGLADNVLWDIKARSGLGDFTLDLTDLRLEKVEVRTRLGAIDVTVPRRGYAQIGLKSWLGPITVRVPEDVAVRIAVRAGEMATVELATDRLQSLGKGRFISPRFDEAATQMDIRIHAPLSDVRLV